MNKALREEAKRYKEIGCAEVTDLGDMVECARYDWGLDAFKIVWLFPEGRRYGSVSVGLVPLFDHPCPPLALDEIRDEVRRAIKEYFAGK